ncbi:MAG: hypothetical protein Q9167_005670 [Letrouitia subvulpina]
MSAGRSQPAKDFPTIYLEYASAMIKRQIASGMIGNISRAEIERNILQQLDEARRLPIDYKASFSYAVSQAILPFLHGIFFLTLLIPQIFASNVFDSFWIGMQAMHSLQNIAIERYKPEELLLYQPYSEILALKQEMPQLMVSSVEGQPTFPYVDLKSGSESSIDSDLSSLSLQDDSTLTNQPAEAEQHLLSPLDTSFSSGDSSSSVASSRKSVDKVFESPTGAYYPVSPASGVASSTNPGEQGSEGKDGGSQTENTWGEASAKPTPGGRNVQSKAKGSSATAQPKSKLEPKAKPNVVQTGSVVKRSSGRKGTKRVPVMKKDSE